MRLVRTYFLIPDRYKQAINTTKGAVFLRHCRCSSSATAMGRTETSIDLLLLFAPISQSSSCTGGRGGPFHNVGSNHDDWDHRTQTAGEVARRRGGAHHRCHRCHDLPDPAGAHERLAGRLAVVFRDRLSVRLLDDHRRPSRSLFRRLRGDCHHPVAERIACVPLCPAAMDAASR